MSPRVTKSATDFGKVWKVCNNGVQSPSQISIILERCFVSNSEYTLVMVRLSGNGNNRMINIKSFPVIVNTEISENFIPTYMYTSIIISISSVPSYVPVTGPLLVQLLAHLKNMLFIDPQLV